MEKERNKVKHFMVEEDIPQTIQIKNSASTKVETSQVSN
jgi:hypothetical protein